MEQLEHIESTARGVQFAGPLIGTTSAFGLAKSEKPAPVTLNIGSSSVEIHIIPKKKRTLSTEKEYRTDENNSKKRKSERKKASGNKNQKAKNKAHRKEKSIGSDDELPSARNMNRNASTAHEKENRGFKKKRLKKVMSQQQKVISCAKEAQLKGSAVVDFLLDTSGVNEFLSLKVITSSILPQPRADHESNDIQTLQSNGKRTRTIYIQPLLVLDLNGILCHRIRWQKEPRGVAQNGKELCKIANTPVIPRTNISSFLEFLNRHFCIAVWTSAKQQTAKELVSVLFPQDLAKNLLFVWSQSKCKTYYRGTDVIYKKDLKKVWEQYPLWNQFNTLIVDDSPEKCHPRYAALHPPPIHGRQDLPLASFEQEGPRWISDEENHSIQMDFFRKLVHHWRMNESETIWNGVGDLQYNEQSETIWTFLRDNGGYMGWRGGTDLLSYSRV